MSERKDGGSAFPAWDRPKANQVALPTGGMSLRDFFAASALQAHIAAERTDGRIVAESCYRYADAMLAEREKS